MSADVWPQCPCGEPAQANGVCEGCEDGMESEDWYHVDLPACQSDKPGDKSECRWDGCPYQLGARWRCPLWLEQVAP